MLSKEEKKAIEMLDKFITEHKLFNINQSDGLEKNIDIVLNLIEKLKKENEQKDKQIDFLSSKLSDVCTGIPQIIEQVHKEYCELMNDNEDCCYKEDKSCQDCIREYSERIVKEEER